MSTSDDVFVVHDSSRQQNGDILSVSSSTHRSRTTMEGIRSVQQNPFYKSYGRRHNVPSYPRTSHRTDAVEERKLSSNGQLASSDDDLGEYRPGSGFVHKLLDKFSSLTAREDAVVPPPSNLKRSSSLDELSVDNDSTKTKTKSSVPANTTSQITVTTVEKPSYLSASKLSHRARSIDNLNHAHRKPHHHNLAVSLRHVETKWDKDKRSALPPKSPRDSHVDAPDVELARDDIIIIENTPPVALPKDDDSESDDGSPRILSAREAYPTDELPKPNTVTSVRSIFENASSLSSLKGGLYSRRHRSDQPASPSPLSPNATLSPLQTESTQDRVSIQSPSPITSPRVFSPDTHAKPVLLPSNLSVSKHFEYSSKRSSDPSSYSSISSSSVTYPRTLSSSRESTPRSDDNSFSSSDSNSVSITTDKKPSGFERSSYFDTVKSDRPYPSQRSTASVKPTIPQRQTAQVKPFTVPTPASAATSYRKSSPVVPVAPFKDKPEDKDDGKPVMIFERSKLSPKRDKQKRIKDYTPLNDSQKKNEKEDLNKDIIIPTESKKISDDNEKVSSGLSTNNKVLSQRRRNFDANHQTADKTTPDQHKIVHTKQQTTIEITKPFRINKDKDTSEETAAPLKPVAAPRPRPNMTPKPRSQAPEPPGDKTQLKPKSMIYISSTESSETDSSTPPETPRTRPAKEESEPVLPETPRGKTSAPSLGLKTTSVDKQSHDNKPVAKVSIAKTESDQQPMKGIPSIIAQRLKQQKSDPSQVADDVVNSSAGDVPDGSLKLKLDDDSSTDSDAASPRVTNLNPVKATPAPVVQDSLSSEIQNEINAVRLKMEDNRSKRSAPAPIFDSSQLRQKKKMKEDQKQRIVPPLDLSGINDDRSKEYRPPQKEIKKCNIVFIGENAKTSRSLLAKDRKIKVNIHFNDAKTETFEYPSESWALEKYLEDHPHEATDILVLEDFGGGNGIGESSDDSETVDIIQTPVSPTGNKDDDLLRSNTALSHQGSLQSYRGRFQQDYEFGAVLKEPEQPKAPVAPEPVVDPDSMMLRPAEEEDTNTWSTSSSSDLLF